MTTENPSKISVYVELAGNIAVPVAFVAAVNCETRTLRSCSGEPQSSRHDGLWIKKVADPKNTQQSMTGGAVLPWSLT